MLRSLPLLALATLVATAAAAQPVYNGLDDRSYDDGAPGVRLGLGVGAFIYDGPDILVGDAAYQDDVTATSLALTAELTAPLAGQLYGRLMGGVVNLGADDTRADVGYVVTGSGTPVFVQDPSYNPFLTSPSILAEADLLYYLAPPRAGTLAPYLFSGISALFATGDAAPGIETTALQIPVGLGIEYGVSRNLALFAEGSYRFGINDVGSETVTAAAASVLGDVCDKDSPDYDEDLCKKGGGETPTCEQDPTQEHCPDVNGNPGSRFDRRFNSGLIVGGLRLGFGGGGRPAMIPPPVVPPVAPPPVAPPPVVEPPPPAPLVCELVELNAVTFDYGSGTLDRRSRSRLDENVELLLSNPACCVFIDGYTDTPEAGRFGLGLAGRRAQAVYDYYLSRGVGAARLQIRNRGVAMPDCDKEDPGPGCELNRRVESIPVDCERFQFLLENPSYDPY